LAILLAELAFRLLEALPGQQHQRHLALARFHRAVAAVVLPMMIEQSPCPVFRKRQSNEQIVTRAIDSLKREFERLFTHPNKDEAGR
jgi:hypothetical protein